MKFIKKPIEVEATQWFKNGDHPEDGCEPGDRWLEGRIVRYFRCPDVPGGLQCNHCDYTMDAHGWIDTLEGGHTVCPSDWIITGIKGENYPCKADIFEETYEPTP